MFFEPDPTAQDLSDPPEPPPIPEWLSPPVEERGVLIPLQTVLARSDNAVVVLSSVLAHTTGCLFLTEVLTRRGGLQLDAWWELRGSGHSAMINGPSSGGGLPDKMLRFGVRLPDGTKATTVGGVRRARDTPPPGPLLTWTPFGSGSRSGGGMQINHTSHGLWLWPLPPPEPLEFAVEWPFGGIDLAIVELDGRQISEAAEHSEPYWP